MTRWILVAGLILGCGGAISDRAAPPARSLNGWDPLPQLEKSRIAGGTFAGGYLVAPAGYLNWYFANLGLSGFVDRVPAEVKQYLNLYIAHLEPGWNIQDVTFDDPYHPETSTWEKKAQDSDDSYAATFLSLAARYVRVTGDTAWFNANLATLKNIAYYNLAVPQNANGLVRVFQAHSSNDVYYTEDNCEDYKGLMDFSAELSAVGDPDASYYAAVAGPIATAVGNLMYLPNDGAFAVVWNGAVNPLSASPGYYPRGVTQAFPQGYQLPVAQSEEDAAWSYLNAQFPSFWNGQYDADPFTITGYTAALRGDTSIATAAQQRVQDMVAAGQAVPINDLSFYTRIDQVLAGGAPF